MKSSVITTVYNAVNAVNTLDSLNSVKCHGALSLHVFRLRKALSEYKEFLVEETSKIIEEFGAVPDENGNYVVMVGESVDDDKTKEFVEKVVEVRKQTIEIEVQKFSIDELDSFELSPLEIAYLDPFIEE